MLLASQLLTKTTEWPTYGNDAGSSKYAALDKITKDNVSKLRVAWQWESPDNKLVAENPRLTPWGFKSTPLKIGSTLFTSTSLGHVAAIDAKTGKTRWLFDTKTYQNGRPTNLGFNHRGVAYWKDSSGRERVLMPTNNAYLWSIDAKTGLPDLSFGSEGRVDLTKGLGRKVDRKAYSVISAPIVIKDILVVGASIRDGPRNKEAPPGHVRGFDIKTGEQKWIFNTIPQKGEFGTDTWENNSWKYSGNTNVWTGLSADLELGYVYLPTGTPTNDWYGGHRLGDNLFAESLVCLDAASGQRVWHFQMIHHGLWDYDLPAAPTLMDIMVEGQSIKAVAQVSKQGFVYVFNRVTGEPVWPIVEKPVPQSNVPGEVSSPTQPFPTKPAPFERQGITIDDLIDFSPDLRKEAEEIISKFEYGPLFTPPSLRGTINLPGWAGGANWTGAAFDPVSKMLYVPSQTGAIVVKLSPGDPEKTNFKYMRSRSVTRVSGPKGLPLTKPPYSRITAINMNTGEHVWMQTNGDGPRERVINLGLPDPGPLGAGWSGAPLLTKTLLFVAQDDDGRAVLRGFDKENGDVLVEIDLPAKPWGAPMSYYEEGKQFIVIASGEGKNARLIALSI